MSARVDRHSESTVELVQPIGRRVVEVLAVRATGDEEKRRVPFIDDGPVYTLAELETPPAEC